MTLTELSTLQPGDLVAWNFTPSDAEEDRMFDIHGIQEDDPPPPLVGTVVTSNEDELVIRWGNGNLRIYKRPGSRLSLENLERLP